MTSLSKVFHNKFPSNKVIQIKSIDVIKNHPKDVQQSHNLEEQYVDLQQKIERAQEELRQLQYEKERLLKDTEDKITKQKEQWAEEKQAFRQQVHEEGYEAGYSLGKEESMKQYEKLIQQGNQIVESATKDYHDTLRQSTHMIIDLAIHTTKKVIKKEFENSPETFKQIVVDAINDITNQEYIHIFVHASQYERLLQQKNELKQLLDDHTNLSIYVDQEAAEDSCVIEYPSGKIDASVDTQLSQIRQALREIIVENNQ